MTTNADASDVRASRLGALLATLQSLEYLTESIASCVGERAGWTLVALLEAWKCACRVRLLQLTTPGQLLRSLPSGSREQPSLTSAARRLRATMSQLEQRAASRSTEEPASAAESRFALQLVATGELLHALQPLGYIVLLLAQLRGAGCLTTGWRRRLPWLVAIGLEAASLQLCNLGTQRLEAQRRAHRNGLASLRLAPSPQLHNSLELRHRRVLLAYMVLRPLARASAKRLLERRGLTDADRPPAWRHASLEALTLLENAIWARYWR